MKHISVIGLAALLAFPAAAQEGDHHSRMMHGQMQGMPRETGQSAFAAIAEIVTLLRNDPATDWSKVDVQALRDHLADMERVTLETSVGVQEISGGAIFTVTGIADAASSAQRMMLAHAPFLAEATGFKVEAKSLSDGTQWRVTSDKAPEVLEIRGLGFYGLLAIGSHHLAIARGAMVH
jgi:hypothetical protein